MLGVPSADRDRFKRWSDTAVMTLGGPFAIPELFERGRQSVDELASYLRTIIAERRVAPRDDLISRLVLAQEEGRALSDQEVLATSILLLIAGNETTTYLITSGMLALFQNEGELNRLRLDPSSERRLGLAAPA